MIRDGNYDNELACQQLASRMKQEFTLTLMIAAAEAAKIDWFDQPAAEAGRGLHMKSGAWWRPDQDDGDSQRLRTKLRLGVEWFNDTVTVVFWDSGKLMRYTEHVANHDDADAALRYATLMAAASIEN